MIGWCDVKSLQDPYLQAILRMYGAPPRAGKTLAHAYAMAAMHQDPLIVAICDTYESFMHGIPPVRLVDEVRAPVDGIGLMEEILSRIDLRSAMRAAMKLHEEREQHRDVFRKIELRKREHRPMVPTLESITRAPRGKE
jgi:hypothetical protein